MVVDENQSVRRNLFQDSDRQIASVKEVERQDSQPKSISIIQLPKANSFKSEKKQDSLKIESKHELERDSESNSSFGESEDEKKASEENEKKHGVFLFKKFNVHLPI